MYLKLIRCIHFEMTYYKKAILSLKETINYVFITLIHFTQFNHSFTTSGYVFQPLSISLSEL